MVTRTTFHRHRCGNSFYDIIDINTTAERRHQNKYTNIARHPLSFQSHRGTKSITMPAHSLRLIRRDAPPQARRSSSGASAVIFTAFILHRSNHHPRIPLFGSLLSCLFPVRMRPGQQRHASALSFRAKAANQAGRRQG